MRVYVFTMIAVLSFTGAAMAQGGGGGGSPPREIGNRANGYDYQPTPSELAPREKAAGIVQSPAQQRAGESGTRHRRQTTAAERGLEHQERSQASRRQIAAERLSSLAPTAMQRETITRTRDTRVPPLSRDDWRRFAATGLDWRSNDREYLFDMIPKRLS